MKLDERHGCEHLSSVKDDETLEWARRHDAWSRLDAGGANGQGLYLVIMLVAMILQIVYNCRDRIFA